MSDSITSDEAIGLRAASEIVARPLAWLWPGRFPLGKVVILDGDPGVGKSLLTLDLCARLSTGQPFPDGSPSPGPCNSIVLEADDGGDDTIVPRLVGIRTCPSSLTEIPPGPGGRQRATVWPNLNHSLYPKHQFLKIGIESDVVTTVSPAVWKFLHQHSRCP